MPLNGPELFGSRNRRTGRDIFDGIHNQRPDTTLTVSPRNEGREVYVSREYPDDQIELEQSVVDRINALQEKDKV